MASSRITARIDTDLKTGAEVVFKAIGLSPSEAIRLFFQQCINTGGLPFRPQMRQPNAETLEAIEELENGGGECAGTTGEFYKKLDI